MFTGDPIRQRKGNTERWGEEKNSRVTLKATGKVVREDEDRQEELDRQGGKKEDENEGGGEGSEGEADGKEKASGAGKSTFEIE